MIRQLNSMILPKTALHVGYILDKGSVLVTEKSGASFLFAIISENAIETNSFGVKTVYNRTN